MKSKNVLSFFAIVVIISILSAVSFKYAFNPITDYGLQSAKNSVDYYIYKPEPIPLGLINATNFTTGKELAGKNNAVSVAFNYPLDANKITEDNFESKIITITQVAVEENFDLKVFSENFLKDSTTQPISLQSSFINQAYFVSKPFENTNMNAITLLMNNNVLIVILSPRANYEELKQMAEALK